MTNFEIAATAYSVVSTLGLAFTAYYGRKFLLAIEQRLHARVSDEVKSATLQASREASALRVHVRSLDTSLVSMDTSLVEHVSTVHKSLKADIARVEKWITEHAEELKSRAEDLRVRALDLHDKTQAGATRQPPTRS